MDGGSFYLNRNIPHQTNLPPSIFRGSPSTSHFEVQLALMSGEPGGDLQMAQIAANVYLLRGQYVMINADLALLYGVATRVLNQAVQRNIETLRAARFHFPSD